MESVPEFISSIIMKIFPAEIAYGIIIMGFIIFFLHFYGTKEWKSFSDLEKIIFSIVTGWLLWFILILPISLSIETLKLFFTYNTDINIFNESINNFYVFSVYIFAYFLGWRFSSNTPLFYNKEFVNFTTNLIKISILIVFPLLLFFLFSFYSSGYINFANYFVERITAVIVLLLVLYLIFLKLHGNLKIILGNHLYFLNNLENHLYLKFNAIKNILTIKNLLIFIIVLMLISSIIGYKFYKSSVDNEVLTKFRLEIPILPLDNSSYGDLSASLLYRNQFELKFGLIKWTYISKNFTITEAYNKDDPTKKYNFSGNSIVLSEDKKINVTLIGYQKINIEKNFSNLDIQYINHTQIWNISFNRKEYEIYINEIPVKNLPENLKLINYKNYGLSINKEKLDEHLNKSIQEFTIQNVMIPSVRYNDGIYITKISLYFTDNNS